MRPIVASRNCAVQTSGRRTKRDGRPLIPAGRPSMERRGHAFKSHLCNTRFFRVALCRGDRQRQGRNALRAFDTQPMRLIVLPKGLGTGLAGWLVPGLLVLALGGCTIAKPRTDDPWEGFNRKMYAFNDAADKAVIRPVASGYRKVTSANVRRVVSNFYDNVKMPITIANNVLQGDPPRAAKSTGRFLVNTTLGFAGLFDPASEMNLPLDETDFGVTLAKWEIGRAHV